MSDLKPCPFCGGEAVVESWHFPADAESDAEVTCMECGARSAALFAASPGLAESLAIAAWNRRVKEVPDEL